MRDAVIKALSHLEDSEVSDKTWNSPEGKEIPYTEVTIRLDENNGISDFDLKFTIWSKNVNISLIESAGETDGTAEGTWAITNVIAKTKVPITHPRLQHPEYWIDWAINQI